MSLSKKEFTDFLTAFDFKSLFNEMGWNRDSTRFSITVDGQAYNLESVGEKQGFKIFVCPPDAKGKIPDSSSRKKIETQVKKRFEEHLIIFHDAENSQQLWQYPSRQPNGPRRLFDTRWNKGQSPELLFQRASGVLFEIDEEDSITIVDVKQRIASNFEQNNERVTKRFYDLFKKEHAVFYDFLTGIDDHIDEWNRTHKKDQKENLNKQWYVSLMLNRLMFCYFIQKKGFLNKNKNYLRDKLAESRQKRGRNKYYSFYRDFLLALFHSGLGAPKHSSELEDEIGKIPYLNGGLFDEHELEKQFEDIEIDDDAFERIFHFFDDWEWHLDTRHAASGRDVNPDVIGYIFEKYINDRAAMGAYYTKEDITEYISKNCILPFVFDEVKRNYPAAFKAQGEIWEMLRESGDKYIYEAIRKGVELELPENIAKGLDTSKPDLLERRADWNRKASDEYALPTEIWREVVDRRRRYSEAKGRIESGEIAEINDFITYNLNIRQFAQDAVENSTDPKFVEHFYKAISKVTILDPTCGSGAFLFAAMNILEPLYGEALRRMRNFVEDEDRTNTGDKKNFSNKYQFFRGVLEQVQNPSHPNQQYFVYKSIILNNLYGVDIMNEAVEVAKLRLFLKLVATVDADYSRPNLGLEPLPDIDFNIRAGNTLIGYVSQEQIDDLSALLITKDDKKKVVEECDVVARAFRRFKECQLDQENDFAAFKKAKDELQTRLQRLNSTLDRTLYKEHYEGQDYEDWKLSHQPFHWLSEFYEIIHDFGGFDVIVGNPPYVEYKDVKERYQVKTYATLSCSNLFAFVPERSSSIIATSGRFGMIIPLSAFSTDRMIPLIEHVRSNGASVHLSNFSWRPAKLFEGVNLQLSILMKEYGEQTPDIFTSNYVLWDSEERPILFSKIQYQPVTDTRIAGSIPKLGFPEASAILTKIRSAPREISSLLTNRSNNVVYYRRGGLYWKVFVDFETSSSEEKLLFVRPETDRYGLIAVLSSDLWWWYLMITSDCRHLGNRDIATFPIAAGLNGEVAEVGRRYVSDLKRNARDTERVYKKTKAVQVLSFSVKNSKPIIDEIDKVLAKHYGFTDEELDFIINYDIKYRMGSELDSGDPSEEEIGTVKKAGKKKSGLSQPEENLLLSGGALFD
jgi:hypothetical protein